MDNSNGHGHVFPRADGVRARCGGPSLCKVCQLELAQKNNPKHQHCWHDNFKAGVVDRICCDCGVWSAPMVLPTYPGHGPYVAGGEARSTSLPVDNAARLLAAQERLVVLEGMVSGYMDSRATLNRTLVKVWDLLFAKDLPCPDQNGQALAEGILYRLERKNPL